MKNTLLIIIGILIVSASVVFAYNNINKNKGETNMAEN